MYAVVTATNCEFTALRGIDTGVWGQQVQWNPVETQRGRIHALRGGEREQAQAIGRDSTHRMYVFDTDMQQDDRVYIERRPYEGTYLVRFVDARSTGSWGFKQIDLQYLDIHQGPD
jgi:SPP1 family predicted phage head-tail adaptor